MGNIIEIYLNSFFLDNIWLAYNNCSSKNLDHFFVHVQRNHCHLGSSRRTIPLLVYPWKKWRPDLLLVRLVVGLAAGASIIALEVGLYSILLVCLISKGFESLKCTKISQQSSRKPPRCIESFRIKSLRWIRNS